MIPQRVTLTPQSDDNGICASQTPLAAGNLTIAGALASGGSVTLNHAHLIVITSAGDDRGRTFTITGTQGGYAQTEAVTGANATAATSTKYFDTVSQITVDDATAGAVIVGVNGLSVSKWYQLDTRKVDFSVGIGVILSNTLTYTVQHTFDDVQVSNVAGLAAFDHDSIAAKSANDDGNYSSPCIASRLQITAYTSGTAKFNLIQAG